MSTDETNKTREEASTVVDHLTKSDWNSVATFGALNSPPLTKIQPPGLLDLCASPPHSPVAKRSSVIGCTLPHKRSPTAKADVNGEGSPIPSHLSLLDRRATQKSDNPSVESTSLKGSFNKSSTGFLTPPSAQSSPGHSEFVAARARLPPPKDNLEPVKKVVEAQPTTHSWHWLKYPKLRLTDYQLKSYLWLSVNHEEPKIIPVNRPLSRVTTGDKTPGRKSVSFIFDDLKQSIDRMKTQPVTPAISRRWSSTGVDQSFIIGMDHGNVMQQERRKTVPFTDKGAEALTAIKAKLTRRNISAHQMDTPTIITLRRASAVLGTVAQRQNYMPSDHNYSPTLPDKWEHASPEVRLAAYLITAEEIHTLAALIRRTFADGTPKGSTRKLDVVNEQPAKPRKNKSRSGSIVSHDHCFPEKMCPADVAITVADVHAVQRAKHDHVPRRNSFQSELSRKTSIVSTVLARKSVHEILWEDDGTPQAFRSSTWNLTHDPEKINLASWTSNSFRRESGEKGVVIQESTTVQPIPAGDATKTPPSAKPPTFRPVWDSGNRKAGTSFVCKSGSSARRKKDPNFPGKLLQASEKASPAFMPIPIDAVVSFPPLPQRSSTSEWNVPLPDLCTPFITPSTEIPTINFPVNSYSDPASRNSSDTDNDERNLYKYGIDASFGVSATAPTTPLIKTTLWGSEESATPPQQRRRSSAIPVGNILRKKVSSQKLGSALGASSGARRKSSPRIDHIRIASPGIGKEEGRAPWRKARKDSGYPGLVPPASPSDEEGGSSRNISDDEREGLLKGSITRTGKMGMELPGIFRKKTGPGLSRLVGQTHKVWEEDEAPLEEERRVWRQEGNRSPSPTRLAVSTPLPSKHGCGREECKRIVCGGNKDHSRSSTPTSNTSRSSGNVMECPGFEL